MRYWRVNQNQTYRHEIAGGYLWSPKRNANGARNRFYESMREVSPGDLIFSFVDTRIAAIGIAKSYCWECPKPTEFGSTGEYWENVGWRVSVSFTPLLNKVRPKNHMDMLRPALPSRYAPLQSNGNGNQALYLTEVPECFAELLAGLIGAEAQLLISRQGLTAAKMKQCIWVKPELVANLEFLEWTDSNYVRHIKFVSLRDDKDPRKVVRE